MELWLALVLAVAGCLFLALLAMGFVPQSYKYRKVAGQWRQNTAQYVTMTDGVEIAVDLWLPSSLQPGQKIPAVMRSTRYGRVIEDGFLGKILVRLGLGNNLIAETKVWDQRGYATVLVDVRGTGASFGTQPIPWSDREIEDLGEIVDWIIRQPWSDGQVGTYGISYHGNTAEMALTLGHPAIVGAIPMFSDYDPYMVARPGGVLNQRFIQVWHQGNQALDNNDLAAAEKASGFGKILLKLLASGVKPVDGRNGKARMKDAIAQHQGNVNVLLACEGAPCKDDSFGGGGNSILEVSPHHHKRKIENSKTPMLVVAGLLDAATADGAVARFIEFSNPQKVLLGPWNHGGKKFADPLLDVKPDGIGLFRPEIQQEMGAFFDQCFSGDAPQEKLLRYYVLGEGAWHQTACWPPAGLSEETWRLGLDQSLSLDEPDEPQGEIRHPVSFDTATTASNRWNTQDGGREIQYGDRRLQDEKMLCFTSAPLAEDLVVLGNVEVSLNLTVDAPDAALFAYFEDVSPDGTSRYISEGQLLLAHRKLNADESRRRIPGFLHSFCRKEWIIPAPLQGEAVEFQLIFTAAKIRAGHRIRLALAGQDATNFKRYPEQGEVNWTLRVGPASESKVIIPCMAQREDIQ